MTQHDLLHLEAPDRETKQIDLGQTQRPDHQGDVVRHVFDPVAGRAGRGGNAATVVKDDLAACGQTIGQQGIPVVQAAAEMLDEEQRGLSAGGVAPAAIGEFFAIHFDEAGGCGQVGIAHFRKPSKVSWLNDVDHHL
ncbi:hypothetical protein D3C72_1427620 [compost metagenome]